MLIILRIIFNYALLLQTVKLMACGSLQAAFPTTLPKATAYLTQQKIT